MNDRSAQRLLRCLQSLLALLLAAAAFAPGRVGAQAAASGAEATPRPEWYGWQTLAVDGTGLILGLALSQTLDVEPEPLGIAAATWYGVSAVGAPAVHFAHGNTEIGLGSFGIRTLVPPVTGFVGLLSGCIAHGHFEGRCARPGWAIGSMAGLGIAAAVDAIAAQPKPPSERPRRHWYGWQLLVLDAAGYAVGAYTTAREPKTDDGDTIHPAASLWAGAYVVGFIGAPITHFAHGEVGTGFASLGLRLFVGPIGALGGLIGFCAATAGSDDCAAVGAQWGLLGGGLAVSFFDAFVLAYEEAEEPPRYTTSAHIGPGSIAISGYF